MKKVGLSFLLLAGLIASFMLSKVPEKIPLLVAAFVFQFIVAGYLSLVVHHSDLQVRTVKSTKFNDRIAIVFILFAISIFFGGCFDSSQDHISFFANGAGMCFGFLVGGILAHKLESRKINNWGLFRF